MNRLDKDIDIIDEVLLSIGSYMSIEAWKRIKEILLDIPDKVGGDE